MRDGKLLLLLSFSFCIEFGNMIFIYKISTGATTGAKRPKADARCMPFGTGHPTIGARCVVLDAQHQVPGQSQPALPLVTTNL